MPLVESLNKDLDDAILRHVAATWDLPKEGPRKFDMSSPKRVAADYKRIWNNPQCKGAGGTTVPLDQGAPSSELFVSNDGINSNKNVPGWLVWEQVEVCQAL